MFERFTDRSRKVMQLATQEAKALNHEFIGTEHILLGLLKEGQGVACCVLKGLAVDTNAVREEIGKIVQAGKGPAVTMGKLPQTPRAKKTIEQSIVEAKNLGHNYVGTEHLLLGLLHEPEGIACQVLTNQGLNAQVVRKEVLSILGREGDAEKAFDATMPDNVKIAAWTSTLLSAQGKVKEDYLSAIAEARHDYGQGMVDAVGDLIGEVIGWERGRAMNILDAMAKDMAGKDLSPAFVLAAAIEAIRGVADAKKDGAA